MREWVNEWLQKYKSSNVQSLCDTLVELMVTSSEHLYLLIPPAIPQFLPCILEVYRYILNRCGIEIPEGPELVWLFRTQSGMYWAQKSFNACWLNIQPRLHEITGYLRWPHFTQSLTQRFNNVSWWIEFRLQKQISLQFQTTNLSACCQPLHFPISLLSDRNDIKLFSSHCKNKMGNAWGGIY